MMRVVTHRSTVPAMGGRRIAMLTVAAVVVLGLAAVHRAALGDFRRAEAAYIEGRAVTACATTKLRPFAEGDERMKDLPEALETIVVDARTRVVEVDARAESADAGLPYPGLHDAVDAVRAAASAQVELYDAMVDDPEGSDDELRRLGLANTSAEHRLARARRWLFVNEPSGWSTRFVCPGQV